MSTVVIGKTDALVYGNWEGMGNLCHGWQIQGHIPSKVLFPNILITLETKGRRWKVTKSNFISQIRKVASLCFTPRDYWPFLYSCRECSRLVHGINIAFLCSFWVGKLSVHIYYEFFLMCPVISGTFTSFKNYLKDIVMKIMYFMICISHVLSK